MKRIVFCLLLTLPLCAGGLALAAPAPAPFVTVLVEGTQLSQGQLDHLAGGADGLALAAGATQGSYTSPEIKVQPFEYAILSWNGQTPAGTSIQVEARFWHDQAKQWTPWLSWGVWQQSPARHSLSATHDTAAISYDTAWVTGDNARASKLQLRATLQGAGVRLRRLCYTLRDTAVAERPVDSAHTGAAPARRLAYSQMVREPSIAALMCSAVTTCTQLNLLGEGFLPEEIALAQYDAGLGGFGNWSFNAALDGALGYKAWVTYADEEQLLRLLDEGRAVGMSVQYADQPGGQYPYLAGAPMTTDGHLVTVLGYDLQDGARRYWVADSAAATDEEALKRYDGAQLMAAWQSRILYVLDKKEADNAAIRRVQATLAATDKEGIYQLQGVPAQAVFLGFGGAALHKPGGGYLVYTLADQPGTHHDALAAGDNLIKFPQQASVQQVTLYVVTNLGITYVARLGQ